MGDDRAGSLAWMHPNKAETSSATVKLSGSVLTVTKLILLSLATLELCPSYTMSSSSSSISSLHSLSVYCHLEFHHHVLQPVHLFPLVIVSLLVHRGEGVSQYVADHFLDHLHSGALVPFLLHLLLDSLHLLYQFGYFITSFTERFNPLLYQEETAECLAMTWARNTHHYLQPGHAGPHDGLHQGGVCGLALPEVS